ncbi:hypothetical protein ABIF38_002093 [Bradyrhizobium japonicum]|uniref:Uncharacterized protein n=1 Tax=Bradyrhizobium elkanii TaxID=29448 RepID=A0ABV4FEB3_BRAEL
MGVSRGCRCMLREQIPTRFALASKATSPFQGEVKAPQKRKWPGHARPSQLHLFREAYFFAGAILLSAGFGASLAASAGAAASAGLSMRSTLAASRSLAT